MSYILKKKEKCKKKIARAAAESIRVAHPVHGPVFLRPIAAMSWAVANRPFGNVERPNRVGPASAGDLGVAPRGLRRIKSPAFHACFCDLAARIVPQRRLVQRMDARRTASQPEVSQIIKCKGGRRWRSRKGQKGGSGGGAWNSYMMLRVRGSG
jgi:hypothetical protein